MSRAKSFRVAGLPSCYHTEKTEQIFNSQMNGATISDFVRDAVLAKAEVYEDFVIPQSGDKPCYISEQRWQEIHKFESKSRDTDYSYLYAFEFLRDKYQRVSKSEILRMAIEDFAA